MPCTIILSHGALADPNAWNPVVAPLKRAGHRVLAVASTQESLSADAEAVGDLVRSVDGPALLVGHSYGGAVISSVAGDCGDIAGLVFVAAFAPEPGESCISLSTMFPGSALGDAGDLTRQALHEAIGVRPLWRDLPTWFLFGSDDREIPVDLQRYMAKRAASRRTVEVPGASHAVAASHPEVAVDLILEAAGLPSWADPLIP